ncbi:hypothetical protein [Reyranella sp. CPCC 100927]|uniref:hypothetical protein n=1 Tax=Reyranella sp. CPCC 100927 TaxID=2599616 RepID=UPI0011B45C97|nr:hypothetical protein [Reyranella sp. CPCC 100927]TWT14823.1 hypothetical protein FQU96_00195 [Reyranella sp. CPCC 100927]
MAWTVLHVAAWLARRPAWQERTLHFMRRLADSAAARGRVGPAADLADLGRQWQKAFGGKAKHPVTAITNDTVYGEIHTHCPLRGTGDTQACWRMMEFDRAVLAKAGGQFVVLRSQAEPGVTVCQVAMRTAAARLDDLVPAHVRAVGSGR